MLCLLSPNWYILAASVWNIMGPRMNHHFFGLAMDSYMLIFPNSIVDLSPFDLSDDIEFVLFGFPMYSLAVQHIFALFEL